MCVRDRAGGVSGKLLRISPKTRRTRFPRYGGDQDEQIAACVDRPPVDTRAYFRGECIRRYPDAVFGVNWASISFNVGEDPIKRILMNEPLKGTKAHVKELLDSSPTAADLVRNLTT